MTAWIQAGLNICGTNQFFVRKGLKCCAALGHNIDQCLSQIKVFQDSSSIVRVHIRNKINAAFRSPESRKGKVYCAGSQIGPANSQMNQIGKHLSIGICNLPLFQILNKTL